MQKTKLTVHIRRDSWNGPKKADEHAFRPVVMAQTL
jgi:hypothetical protein